VSEDLISVIIPAHDVEPYIGRTLASVVAQSHRALDILVVDDGSTDGTAEVVERWAAADARIRLIRTECSGVSAARNRAIAESRGEWVAPLDGDDLWHPEKLARQLAVMRAHGPEVGFVYSWSAGIDERDRVILPAWIDSTASGRVLEEIVVRGIVGNGSTPLIRRSCLDAVGGYDETVTLGEDWKLYTALAGVTEFAVVPEHLTGYRLRDESASLDVVAMERALEGVTAWIRAAWPELPEGVLRDRDHVVQAYLAVLAVRQGLFGLALHYLWMAMRARPAKLFDPEFFRLFAMWIVHAVGLKWYRWDFWRRPRLEFAPPSGEPEGADAALPRR
jgi:glycosyltransferase involved in cell wall biosynthesis